MKFAAVIVAAGSGARAGAETPKQWRSLAGRPIARWSLEALLAAGAEAVAVVIRSGDEPLASAAFSGLSNWIPVVGGAERIDSVRAGLAALEGRAHEAVLIHDAARPFVTTDHVRTLLRGLEDVDAALPALVVADTLKRRGNDTVITVQRDGLFRAQTPQAFRRAALTAAYAAWPAGEVPTDDAAVIERVGGRVALVPGDPMLLKLTYPEDRAAGGRGADHPDRTWL